jgi:flagellar biosynthesis/type III secretory pathway protein FliH
MAKETEIRQELADERRNLTEAVDALREEIDQTAERGKKIGIAVGAAAGAVLTLRTVRRIRRYFRD